jgi:recombinational DNA repair protein RecR
MSDIDISTLNPTAILGYINNPKNISNRVLQLQRQLKQQTDQVQSYATTAATAAQEAAEDLQNVAVQQVNIARSRIEQGLKIIGELTKMDPSALLE